MNNEIKEAVEIWKQYKEIGVIDQNKIEKAGEVLLNFAEQYLAIEGFPKEEVIDDLDDDYFIRTKKMKNIIIGNCKLSLIKKLDVIEEIIFDIIRHYEFIIGLDGETETLESMYGTGQIKKLSKKLSDAIRQKVMGGVV